jgi:hypothetical protein
LKNFHEYLIQNSLKSGGTKDHFRWVKVPGTTLIERTEYPQKIEIFYFTYMYIGMYRDNFAWDIYCGDASQIVISY